MSSSTRTARLAAEAIGTDLGSIVKSLLFVADDQPVLVLVSGDHRADLEKLRSVLGASRLRIASAAEVHEATGFAIGGVPPIAHEPPLRTLIDETLKRFGTLYAAAGTPSAVFSIQYKQLAWLTSGEEVDCTE
jgi:prolyl-tRNA editing enzyme YbaK/EbsC (Cys-tRNA(Pro) deacylase)